MKTPAPELPLDAMSAGIIEALQKDGRRSYSSIGAEVGLSEAAVRQRVQKMIETGVFEIVAVTDPAQLGFSRSAMVGVSVTGPLEPVADALAEIDEVTYLVLTAGMWDLLAEVVCEDDEHLLRVVSEQIRSVPGITSTETLVYLGLHKQTYDEGVRLPVWGMPKPLGYFLAIARTIAPSTNGAATRTAITAASFLLIFQRGGGFRSTGGP